MEQVYVFAIQKLLLLLPLVALGGDLLLMESALEVGRKERLFLSVRGSKGVWGMEDSPTINCEAPCCRRLLAQVYLRVYSFRPCR